MFPRVLESLSLMVLWVCSLVTVVALVGMVIAVVPLGWAPLFIYSCIGLWCSWILYRRTVKPDDSRPVSMSIIIQCGFSLFVALVCFVLGMAEIAGFDRNSSEIAALPVVFFALIMFRRIAFSVEPPKGTIQTGFFARFFLTLGYIWMAVVLAYIAWSMAGTFMTNFFEGVSLLVSPLNPVSWLVIFLWFLPAFLLRAMGRAMRTVRPY